MQRSSFAFARELTLLTFLLSLVAVTASSPGMAQAITAAINKNGSGDRISVSAFNKLQRITNQLGDSVSSSGLASGLYEVIVK